MVEGLERRLKVFCACIGVFHGAALDKTPCADNPGSVRLLVVTFTSSTTCSMPPASLLTSPPLLPRRWPPSTASSWTRAPS